MANLRADNLTGTGGRNAIDGSVFFDGESSYLTMASGEIISGTGFGTNDFTIEFWINQGVNASDYTGIFNLKASTTTDRFQVAFQSSTIQVYTDTATWRDTGYAPTAGVFEHIAFQRDYSGNTLKMYANGVEKWSVSNTRDYDEAFETFIGLHSSAYGYLEGYISNLRVCTHLVYASNNFTPPTQKLGLHHETILLCCQDSDDPTQEATGKTITGVGGLSINETEYVTNGTFGGSGTSPGGSTYSPAWTVWGDTTTAQNGGLFIERTSTLTGAWQLLTPTGSIPAGQYRIRGQISNKTGPGSAIIRLSSASQGNGTIFFGSYGPGVVESTVTYSGSGNLYMNLMFGNNTGSADFSNISFRQVYTAGGAPKVLPPVGIDAGVVFDGYTKINSPGVMYFPTGDTAQRANSRGRAVIPGGYNPSNSPVASRSLNTIEYIEINTTANAVDFGDLSYGSASGGTCSSSTRAVTGGGYVAPSYGDNTNSMSYFTIASTGNGTNFGDLTVGRGYVSSLSSDTRGIWAGGAGGPASPFIQSDVSVTDYVTIASEGNATSFGELIDQGYMADISCSSPTRGVIAGGNPTTNVIQYVTIATTGVAKDFGDLTSANQATGAASSHTRAVFCGSSPGAPAYTALNHIDYLTIATTGNASDFGDALYAGSYKSGTSNCIRAVWTGTYTSPTPFLNSIEYAQIQTLGNTVDFGDSTNSYSGRAGATSDSHGGLS